MKQTSSIIDQPFYRSTPESFRREVEAHIRFVESFGNDVSVARNLIKSAFFKVVGAVKALRNSSGDSHKAA